MIKFTVYEEPVAKGRPKFACRKNYALAYTPKKTKQAEARFLLQALKHRPNKLLEGPLKVTLNFYKIKPKSYPKRIKYWTKKPDLDNLIKIVDCLNGKFWKDDSQIIEIQSSKQYGSVPRTEIKIEEVKEDG